MNPLCFRLTFLHLKIHFYFQCQGNLLQTKIILTPITLVLRIILMSGFFFLMPDQAVGQPFCKNFLIAVKAVDSILTGTVLSFIEVILKEFLYWCSTINYQQPGSTYSGNFFFQLCKYKSDWGISYEYEYEDMNSGYIKQGICGFNIN